MRERSCKVMESTVAVGAAEVRFRGAWLREAGFVPGLTVKVMAEAHGVLVLRVIGPIDGQAVAAALDRATEGSGHVA